MLSEMFDFAERLSAQISERPLPFVIASTVAVGATMYLRTVPRPKTHYINPKGTFELTDKKSKDYYAANGRAIVLDWFKKHPEEPVTIMADFGPVTVLPMSMTDEIRNDSRLKFMELTSQMFHANLPGFEAFLAGGDQNAVKAVVIKDLTRQLAKVTEPLTEEASMALKDLFTDEKEFHDIHLKETILRVIARVSSRVFIGTELCRNEDWLRITREYTVVSFQAAQDLRLYPWFYRPIANMYLPQCQKNRKLLAEARAILAPIITNRRKMKAEAASRGETLKFNDAIDWFDNVYNGKPFDAVMPQVILAVAAIHTTTDLTTQVVADLAIHQELLEPLRKEIIAVLTEDGWAKTSLYKMKLLDSVIKETQRLKPISFVTMLRLVSSDLTLSNGLRVAKGNYIGINAAQGFWDGSVHEDPNKYDGYRFLRMRDVPESQHKAHLVSTSPEHLAFGHGEHACPGRFFAANEVKIVLINILLKYDFKFPEGTKPNVLAYGFGLNSDPAVSLSIRRRESEIDF